MTIRRRVRIKQSALLLLGVAALILQGARCEAQTDKQLLARSVLSYHYHSAPLAPVFLSEYEVTIEPSRSVRLWYRFGPGSPGDRTTHAFRLSSQKYRKLIDTLAGAGVLANGWTAGATPLGASQESVTIAEPSGKTITISSVLAQEPMTRFLVVVEAMRASVPKTAWISKDRDQQTYQTSMR